MSNKQVTITKTTKNVPKRKNGKRQIKNNRKNALPSGYDSAARRATAFALSDCSRDYLKALVNPFTPLASPVCVPDLLDTPSFKTRTIMRGQLVCGTNVGFVIANPFNAACNNSIAVYSSTSSYALNTLPVDASTPGIAGSGNLQSSFSITQIGNGSDQVNYRPVAQGIRVRYIGTDLNASGQIILFRLPLLRTISSNTPAQLLSYENTRTVPCDRKWHYISWIPIGNTAYSYNNTNPGALLPDGNTYGMMVVGAVTNNAFEWEAVSYHEYFGATLNTTPSHSDVQGMSAVRDFTSQLASSSVPSSPESAWQQATSYIKNLTPKEVSGWVETSRKVLSAGAMASSAWNSPQLLLTGL